MTYDPYAMAPAPTPAPPPMGQMMSPEDLERFLAMGGQIGEDGSLIPPGPPPAFTSSMPSQGAMTGAENAGQIAGPAWQPGQGASPLQPPPPPGAFASPIFGAYNAVANPVPNERDPLRGLGRDPNAERPGPRAGMNVMVPGGASIQDGTPMAAPPPMPPPNVKTTNTYHVQMAPSEESAGRLLQTEQIRGQNKQAQRDYDEMTRRRKVQTLRGFMGRG